MKKLFRIQIKFELGGLNRQKLFINFFLKLFIRQKYQASHKTTILLIKKATILLMCQILIKLFKLTNPKKYSNQ